MLNIPAQMEDYVANYQGGDCFFAQPRDMLSTPVRVLGMGASTDNFERFMASFTSRFGTEPDITLHQVTPPQCPVVNAVRHLMTAAADGSQSLTIASTLLPAGGTLNGQVAGGHGRHLDLLFVSDKGETFKLTSLVKDGTFSVQFGRKTMPATGEPLPQILLLIASNKELASLSALNERQSQPAELVFPALLEEAAQGADVSMEVRYFKIER
jgi:serine/threonine-protein kinase